MKYTKYTKYVADLADEMSMEDLLSALSDYLLESGFHSDSMYFQQMDEHSLEALRQAIQQALESGDFLDEEMRERLEQMQAEGTEFRPSTNVGVDLSAAELRADFDAVVLAGGATLARGLPIPGHDLDGIHQAMEYLPLANRVQQGDLDDSPITAAGRRVVIIGGGDTGADCLGTAHRQGAASVHQFEIMPRPPDDRAESTPWPLWPLMMRTSSAHEEGGERVYAVTTTEFVGTDGRVSGLRGHEVVSSVVDGRPTFERVDGTDFELSCELVLLAMGFVGPQPEGLLADLGVELTERGNVARDERWATNVDDVFVCGDMGRGQSLIVWAIAEGRSAAAAVDRHLMGETLLPAPLVP